MINQKLTYSLIQDDHKLTNSSLLNTLKIKSLHVASNLYGIPRKAIPYWIQQKEELMEVTYKINTIALHQ